MSKRRQIIGWILLGIGIICCSISLLHVRRTVSDAYSASGVKAAFHAPNAPCGNVMINSAGPEELTALPGIGPSLGNEICVEREKNGPFFYPEDLISVKGIGKAKLALFRDNLNMSAE